MDLPLLKNPKERLQSRIAPMSIESTGIRSSMRIISDTSSQNLAALLHPAELLHRPGCIPDLDHFFDLVVGVHRQNIHIVRVGFLLGWRHGLAFAGVLRVIRSKKYGRIAVLVETAGVQIVACTRHGYIAESRHPFAISFYCGDLDQEFALRDKRSVVRYVLLATSPACQFFASVKKLPGILKCARKFSSVALARLVQVRKQQLSGINLAYRLALSKGGKCVLGRFMPAGILLSDRLIPGWPAKPAWTGP